MAVVLLNVLLQIWVTVMKNGLVSAAYFWPGSEVEGNCNGECYYTCVALILQ